MNAAQEISLLDDKMKPDKNRFCSLFFSLSSALAKRLQFCSRQACFMSIPIARLSINVSFTITKIIM